MTMMKMVGGELHQVIAIPQKAIHEGYMLTECYLSGTEIVVIGEVSEDDEQHNCDWMGCGWNHVVYRISRQDLAELNTLAEVKAERDALQNEIANWRALARERRTSATQMPVDVNS